MDLLIQALILGLSLAVIYLPIALGFNLIFGVMRILNFAHGDFYMLGGMLAWWTITQLQVDPRLAVVLATLMVAAFGAVVERVLFRRLQQDLLSTLIVAIALSLLIENVTVLVSGTSSKHYSLSVGGVVNLAGVAIPSERIVAAVVSLISLAGFYAVLQRTRLGWAIRAVAQDREAAMLQGIDPGRMRLITMALGSGITALAGALAGATFGVDANIGTPPFLQAMIVVVLGGLGSIEGTLIAGLIVFMATSVVTILVGAVEASLAGFGLLYLVLQVRPSGLFGRAAHGYV
jgi:branched-chain amino acid transport system permease protein